MKVTLFPLSQIQGQGNPVRRARTSFDHFAALANPAVSVYSAARLRRTLLANCSSGNLSFGFILTPSQSITWSVFSKDEQPAVDSPRFPGLTSIQPERKHCTEFRILNRLAIDGDIQINDDTFVDLYTDNAPCNSCAQVIHGFLAAFPKATIRIMYQHRSDPQHYCDWPEQINEWDRAIQCRIKHQQFRIPEPQDLFKVGSRYAFVDIIGNKEVVKWRYQLLNIDPDNSTTIWRDDEGNFASNVELAHDYYKVYRYSRKTPDSLEPLPQGALEKLVFR